jgi:hypothetical protein
MIDIDRGCSCPLLHEEIDWANIMTRGPKNVSMSRFYSFWSMDMFYRLSPPVLLTSKPFLKSAVTTVSRPTVD